MQGQSAMPADRLAGGLRAEWQSGGLGIWRPKGWPPARSVSLLSEDRED